MTDVVLVNLRAPFGGPPVQREHLGLAYLASYLLDRGHSVDLIDFEWSTERRSALVARILSQRPRIVGFSPFVTNIIQVLDCIDELAASGNESHITLGGHHATFHCREILSHHPSVDSIVAGEGELAFAELAEIVRSGRSLHDTLNIACRVGNRLRRNPCRPLIRNLDRLPFPHRGPWIEDQRRTRVASMISSRGCYARCGFCSIRSFYALSNGKPWRARSPENVVQEMQLLSESDGVQHIIFLDDNFLGPGPAGRRRARAIAAEIQARRLRLRWTMACRANDVDEETLAVLAEAGLVRADLGVESWIPRQLALYEKGVSAEQNDHAIKILERLGLEYRLYLIPVDPYVDVEELLVNVSHMRRVGVSHMPHPLFNRLMCFEGTRLARKITNDGLSIPRVPDRPHLGELRYRYLHPAMKEVWPALSGIDAELRQAIENLRGRALDAAGRAAEAAFLWRLLVVLNEFALASSEKLLLAFQRGEREIARSGLRRYISAIRECIQTVEDAYSAGAFERLAEISIRLGETEIKYPPPTLRHASDELTAQLERALSEDA